MTFSTSRARRPRRGRRAGSSSSFGREHWQQQQQAAEEQRAERGRTGVLVRNSELQWRARAVEATFAAGDRAEPLWGPKEERAAHCFAQDPGGQQEQPDGQPPQAGGQHRSGSMSRLAVVQPLSRLAATFVAAHAELGPRVESLVASAANLAPSTTSSTPTARCCTTWCGAGSQRVREHDVPRAVLRAVARQGLRGCSGRVRRGERAQQVRPLRVQGKQRAVQRRHPRGGRRRGRLYGVRHGTRTY
jgi:hypothetical protein